ncbi:hypothetical protein NE865_09242 [Phthorimaea operculella]|nr:hypothetical protein NE865_09242 [Phthorimaea operculella]
MNKAKGTKSKSKTATSTCKKCKKSTEQQLIKCTVCQTSYHFDCIGRSEKLHRLRSSTNYKCEACIHPTTNTTCKRTNSTKKPAKKATVVPVAVPAVATPSNKKTQAPLVLNSNSLVPAPSPIESVKTYSPPALPLKVNISVSKEMESSAEEKSENNISDGIMEMESSPEEKTEINIPTSNSFSNLPVDDYENDFIVTQTLNNSCPELIASNQNRRLKTELSKLETKLSSMDSYVTKLLLENDTLKKKLHEYELKINKLTHICKSPHPSKNLSRLNATKLGFTPNSARTSSPTSNGTPSSFYSPTLQPTPVLTPDDENLEENYISIIEDDEHSTDEISHSLMESNSSTPGKKVRESSAKQKIVIYGTQQCSGIAATLLHSRKNTPYEQYQVTAFVKPYANTAEILKDCHHLETSDADKIVLCVGENDSDPLAATSELYTALKSLQSGKKNSIIVMKVSNSNYLNSPASTMSMMTTRSMHAERQWLSSSRDLQKPSKLMRNF